MFHASPITSFFRNTNHIGSNTVEPNKKLIKSSIKLNGKCSPCLSDTRTFCCKQVMSTASFKSSQTKRTFKIFHYIHCKYRYVLHLLECNLCKIQFVGKSETPFNIRLSNHRKDFKDPSALPADKHFTLPEHNFNNNAKYTLRKFLDKKLKEA